MRISVTIDPKPKTELEVITHPPDYINLIQTKPFSDRRRAENFVQRHANEMKRLLYTETGVPRCLMTRTWLYINRYDTVPYGSEWDKLHIPPTPGDLQPEITWKKNEKGWNTCSVETRHPSTFCSWEIPHSHDAKETLDYFLFYT